MEIRERLEWLGRIALLLFVLASAAFLSAILAMRIAIQGRVVVMPEVTGKKEGEARIALQSRGLGMRVEARIYSAQPLDSVVRQSPPAGIRAKVGQYAHVVLSLGPQKVTIPALKQRSLREARIELLRDGLQIGEISSAYLPGFAENTVVEQNPPSGSTDAASPQVNLLVSQGAPHPAYVMPGVTGMMLFDAVQRLTASGLKASKITLGVAPGVAHGIVTSQAPVQGSRIEMGAPVELQVAE